MHLNFNLFSHRKGTYLFSIEQRKNYIYCIFYFFFVPLRYKRGISQDTPRFLVLVLHLFYQGFY